MTSGVLPPPLGGSGFLGQHVVFELQKEAQKMHKGKGTPQNSEGEVTAKTAEETNRLRCIKEIRVLDVKPYNPCLGIKNVVSACCRSGVRALIHTSTLSVKVAGTKLLGHTETLTPHIAENNLTLGNYARMRLRAEEIVLGAHDMCTDTGDILQTIVLRPPLLYGEGDPSFVPYILRLASASGNRLPSVGNPAAFLQAAYAGNLGVAHVYALKHLLNGPAGGVQGCGGLPMYVTDDTPPNNLPGLAEPFLHHLHLQPSRNTSYWVLYLLLILSSLWAFVWSLLGYNSEGIPSSLPLLPLHRSASTIIVVSRMRAELHTGYTPAYTWEEARQRSNSYYTKNLM
ncbi:3 beta-hydroxysteroid dehydrogenase/Delta 5--_4-isomerase-like isoform X3 [Homarus americanus]|uniref:3 beta-hydroxysteroid dehydrogenase/Delta 5-->4-isomerase-like isoform X3 n=1 Tax=Homarus americanus TaxID=6706 RepID=UPI001C47F648|nr:3 beta-hydroxysteroid dehydrogenase/Delta 5-->4-isomerase-like isoform X3 [Homarus americanus]